MICPALGRSSVIVRPLLAQAYFAGELHERPRDRVFGDDVHRDQELPNGLVSWLARYTAPVTG